MSEQMHVLPFDVLLKWILQELEHSQSIFGIPRSLFYTPPQDAPYAIPNLFGHYLATPIGPAAGPHTQLAQNIVCAWLCGGRFLELKTVQIMDELKIDRPCIDMEDEGYNVEWSQELKLKQSAREYVKAWALLHILPRLLGWEGKAPLGTVFNLSVGYNLAGIQSPPLTRFMDRLVDAAEELAAIQAILQAQFPQFADIEIPSRLTDNVTLSTMHGCPPDEIERIARYLLEERGLHTTVKLNPTLLGKETVLHILHDDLGFHEIHIPDAVFEHDLQYGRAVQLIQALQGVAAQRNVSFGVKLSNTLAMTNHKGNLPGGEMYMSGRALYPITMNLFHKLAQEFHGDLNVSYSAGADALNLPTILACGARPVTAATDLLKPGGYARLRQYLENLEGAMRERGVTSLEQWSREKLGHLETAARQALQDPRYKKVYHPYGLPKVESSLGRFDCIVAPCREQCPVVQDVPEYAWLIAQGEYDRALEVILSRNPLPGVTGYICTHLCQTRCTRNNYDQPVAIRALKRVAAETGRVQVWARARGERKVAIIGSGPSGLAAAYFLALNGAQVTVYEAKDQAGGMMAIAPAFRLPHAIMQEDIERIEKLGVKIELNRRITTPPEDLLAKGFDAVYLACGFPGDAQLDIPGGTAPGVWAALDVLERTARGEKLELGAKVLVIGGGNTAMDAARTARRITGQPVTVVYRRTQREMPATVEEREELLAEGNTLIELASPTRVILRNGRVAALECVHNRLGEPGADGRREPLPIEGSAFQIEADSTIVAIGQRPDTAFLKGSAVVMRRNGAIAVDAQTGGAGSHGVYAGGDVVHGPATVIQACADGRRAAEAICAQLGMHFEPLPSHPATLLAGEIGQVKRVRAQQEAQYQADRYSTPRSLRGMLPVAQRGGLNLVEPTLSKDAAQREAARCMQCSTLCDKCVEVCPNRANYTYFVSPLQVMVPRLACQEGRLAVTGEQPFQVQQARQIIHVDDFCNECGNCATFCVHQGKPYSDKPRLFLRQSDFQTQSDNAYHIIKREEYANVDNLDNLDNVDNVDNVLEGWILRRREDGQEARLTMADGAAQIEFENDWVSVTLGLADLAVKSMALKREFAGELSLVEATEMYLILQGVSTALPFLPFETS